METLVGQIIQVRFYNENSKFAVILIKDENNQRRLLTGLMFNINTEIQYRFYGSYQMHQKYGMQFKFERYEEVLANDIDQVIKYLSSSLFKGIGKKIATRIVDKLGSNALELIKENNELLDKIDGVTPEKKQIIINQLKQDHYQEAVAYLYGKGISLNLIEKMIQTYDNQLMAILENSPYRLLDDIENIGFKNVDKIALSLGIKYDDIDRIEAMIIQLIKEICYQRGNTYVDFNELVSLLKKNDSRIEIDVYVNTIDGLIEQNKLINHDEKIFVELYEQAEQTIVNILNEYIHTPLEKLNQKKVDSIIEDLEYKQSIQFANMQKQAMIDFLKYPLMILTGGPGTGKTTIVKAAIHIYQKIYNQAKIALVAPTGRAAKRMNDLTGLEAQTIHRLLRWDVSTNEFMLNEESPIDYDLLIIDEFSMVDTVLFSCLLKASCKVRKILIIGDDQQLPSVAPGNLLHDLLNIDKIHQVRLTEIYRQKQDSGIIKLAHDISINYPVNFELFNQFQDISFIECNSMNTLSLIQKIVNKAINEGYNYNDFQILAPMYQGIAGIDAINSMMQDMINPLKSDSKEITFGQRKFRTGDKVLQLKNRVEDNVFNGDIGTIIAIHLKDNFNYLSDTIIVDFEGVEITYTPQDFIQLTLAYCTSIHKAQGSEFKIVIMPILNDYNFMLRKNLIYTGITRAKQSLFLIGQPQVFLKGLLRTQEYHRLTYLKERFNEYSETLSPYNFM